MESGVCERMKSASPEENGRLTSRPYKSKSVNLLSSGLLKTPRTQPSQTANASSLTLSSRRRRRIEGASPEPVEGRGESNARVGARGHPSIRGFAATQDEAERTFSTTPRKERLYRRGVSIPRYGAQARLLGMRRFFNSSFSLWFDYRRAERGDHGFQDNDEMQIIIFPVKFSKFTGFFDKFLKIISPVNDCNQMGYHINLSVPHSDPAAKKVFRPPRICPQLPAFPPAPHRVLEHC